MRASVALALALLLGAGAVMILLVDALPGRRDAPPARQAAHAPEPGVLASAEGPRAAREPLEAARTGAAGRPRALRLRSSERPTSERELRAAFVRRERAEPGALEREAAALLASDRAREEKVALLRALEDVGSPELDAWLEQAVLVAPDHASAEGQSVASFALERLAQGARRSEARQVLLRLAFPPGAAGADPRRATAAAAFAAACPAHELGALENALCSVRDEEIVRRVALALHPRRAEPPVRRLFELLAVETAAPPPPLAEAGLE